MTAVQPAQSLTGAEASPDPTERCQQALRALATGWEALHAERAPGAAARATVRWLPPEARTGAGEQRQPITLHPAPAPARLDVLDVLADTAVHSALWEDDIRSVLGMNPARRKDARDRSLGGDRTDGRVLASLRWLRDAMPAAAEQDADASRRVGLEARQLVARVQRARGLGRTTVALPLACPLCGARSLVVHDAIETIPGHLDGRLLCLNVGGCRCCEEGCEAEDAGRPHEWPSAMWDDLAPWLR